MHENVHTNILRYNLKNILAYKKKVYTQTFNNHYVFIKTY